MTRSHAVKLSATLLAGIAVSACASATMAPRYERPPAPVPASLPYAENEPGGKAMLLSWRDVFIDPKLQRLIETALANNRDLRVAVLNVERARALYRVQRSESFPEIDATQNYFRQRTGENAATGVVGAPGPSGGRPITTVQNSVNASVSAYELDLFGRVRSLNRQALETYFSEEETRKAAEISLVAEVANAYLQLAADRELLAIAQDTYRSQQASLDLTRELVENGVGNDLDVERARTSVEAARAYAAALEAQLSRDENALRLLLGAPPPEGASEARSIDAIEIQQDIPAGLSSEILLGRPDILAAEHRLKGANANIGAARAAFFPRILLTASAGTASAELTDLFEPGTAVWRFAPSISVPIFTGGRNRAQLSAAKTDRKIAQAQYEQSIQTAFRDVADALATRRTIGEQIDATENLADAASKSYELAQARFRNGVDNYLSVLDAQRADYAARQELVAARLARAASLIALYRALGGDFGGA